MRATSQFSELIERCHDPLLITPCEIMLAPEKWFNDLPTKDEGDLGCQLPIVHTSGFYRGTVKHFTSDTRDVVPENWVKIPVC